MAKPVSQETLNAAASSRKKYRDVEKYKKQHGLTGSIGYDPETGEYYVMPSYQEMAKNIQARQIRIEQRYEKALKKIKKDIEKLLKDITDPNEAYKVIEDYAKSAALDDLIRRSVSRMITGQAVGQKATWKAAAAESMRGREFYQLLMQETSGTPLGAAIAQIIYENSYLIKTVPHDIALRMSQYARQQAHAGMRPEDTIKKMREMAPHLAEYKLKRIARTETAKAQTALLQTRAEQLGVKWYKWKSSHDERVRDAHAMMDGIYCRWSDPPNPERVFGGHDSGNGYHPGCIYNCRCIALPVIHPNDIQFPAKCWINGRVVTIGSRTQFDKL